MWLRPDTAWKEGKVERLLVDEKERWLRYIPTQDLSSSSSPFFAPSPRNEALKEFSATARKECKPVVQGIERRQAPLYLADENCKSPEEYGRSENEHLQGQ